MSIRLLSRAFGRGFVPRAALDMEALRIGAAMEHIKSRGNLDGFLAGRSERLALMSTAGKQGLVVWNKNRSRYELTSLGESRLGVSRTHVSDPSRSDRVVGPDSVRSRMKSRLLGAVAGAAACAGLIAWLPLGYSKAPLVPQASRNSVTVPAAGASPLPASIRCMSNAATAARRQAPMAGSRSVTRWGRTAYDAGTRWWRASTLVG
jgi:hypothetical protein